MPTPLAWHGNRQRDLDLLIGEGGWHQALNFAFDITLPNSSPRSSPRKD
jgi:hypothetical protein